MKINDKTQSQRLLELMDEIVSKDGEITSGRELTNKHHLDPRVIRFLQNKGILMRPSRRGAIHWISKLPDQDMAVLVTREFNNWANNRAKDSRSLPKPKPKESEAKIFIGYRLNIFGWKIRLKKPTIRIEKEYAPF